MSSAGGGRDRDSSGRPRNARPRDALGRPLRRGAAGSGQLAPDLPLAPSQALLSAQQLLDADRPFEAHEVLEARWKASPAPDRSLWRGLAQIAVGITHARRGNQRGATALLRRGAAGVGAHAGEAHGLDTAAVAAQAEDLATRIEREGLAFTTHGVRLRLVPTGPPPREPRGA